MVKTWWESVLIGEFSLVVGKRMSKFLTSAGLLPISCPDLDQNWKTLWWFSVRLFFMVCNALTKVTIVNFPPKKYPRPIFTPKLWSPVFYDELVHKYQTQLCLLTKLRKSFLWITSACLKFRHSNFSHCTKL